MAMLLRKLLPTRFKLPPRERVHAYRPPTEEQRQEFDKKLREQAHDEFQWLRDGQLRLVCSMRTCAAARDREAGYDTAEAEVLRAFAEDIANRDPYDV